MNAQLQKIANHTLTQLCNTNETYEPQPTTSYQIFLPPKRDTNTTPAPSPSFNKTNNLLSPPFPSNCKFQKKREREKIFPKQNVAFL